MKTIPIPQTLNDVLVTQLCELHTVESHFLKILPKMAQLANDQELKTRFLDYHAHTRRQLARLEHAAAIMGIQLGERHEPPMVAVVAAMAPDNTAPSMAMDAQLICGAHKVESYQKAGSVGICTFAKMLGLDEVATVLLAQTSEGQFT